MTHEDNVAQQFARAVTYAPDMTSRVLIDGLPYVVGDVLHEMTDVSGHDYRDEMLSVLARVARTGDKEAQDLIRRMGETFAYLRCPPEPEPEDAPMFGEERQLDARHFTEAVQAAQGHGVYY